MWHVRFFDRDNTLALIAGLMATSPLLFSSLASAATVPSYAMAPTEGGAIIVNELTGGITFCGAIFASTTAPIQGSCKEIGSMPDTNLQGNIQISIMTPSPITANGYVGSNAVILNTATGQVVVCPAWSGSGTPVGLCRTAVTVP